MAEKKTQKPQKNGIAEENDMGTIKLNRIDIRRVVEDACHDLISDKKLAEMLYIKIMQPLEDYLDDCEEGE